MAPTPSSKNHKTPTPFSKLSQPHVIHNSRTPQAKHRLNFIKEGPTLEHPIEVIGRIRDYSSDKKEKDQNPFSSSSSSLLQVINPDLHSLRVKTEIGYRDFSLDGVSLSEEEDLDMFYTKFVESRINGVKLGEKCTIMMYGPTGAGKSYTMFGSSKQPGIVYKSLKGILGEGNEENVGVGTFVQVTVLEIYNEELYDLLSTNNAGGGFGFGWSKGNASKVRLEVIGKKAKNATFISGNEAIKISKEIQKVEKRRIVKSTLCNERSSRSHCMIILDVPTVGGRLMLVDMAGSENIEQAGQTGLEAKMQTGKINQGNIALKRVVESIANGDSHVPFRDSKLTMLLQDSFEDDKSKILMILCASPDPKELHKTISTLEYGAKAKCIVRGPHTPVKEKGAEDTPSAISMGSRIAAMDQFIHKLQLENKLIVKECNEAKKELLKKEEELATLRCKLELVHQGVQTTEEDIVVKVNERNEMLKSEFDKKIQQYNKMADEIIEMERRKMEERMLIQQQESEMLRRRLEEIEAELWRSRVDSRSTEVEENNFAKRLLEVYSEDSGMVKSMDLDRSIDMDSGMRDVVVYKAETNTVQAILGYPSISNPGEADDPSISLQHFTNKSCLTTVFEEEHEGYDGEEEEENPDVEEVQKEVIEEKMICSGMLNHDLLHASTAVNHFDELSSDAAPCRKELIQNIFTLCGTYRELTQQQGTESKPAPVKEIGEDSPVRKIQNISELAESFSEHLLPSDNPETIIKSAVKQPAMREVENDSKENFNPTVERIGADLAVHLKWEAASEENPGIITTLNVVKDSTLADLRKLIEIYLGADNQELNFLDMYGAPVPKEQEAVTPVSKLPRFNNQLHGHLACLLRPVKGTQQPNYLPFTPLENSLPLTLKSHGIEAGIGYSPKVGEHMSSHPLSLSKDFSVAIS